MTAVECRTPEEFQRAEQGCAAKRAEWFAACKRGWPTFISDSIIRAAAERAYPSPVLVPQSTEVRGPTCAYTVEHTPHYHNASRSIYGRGLLTATGQHALMGFRPEDERALVLAILQAEGAARFVTDWGKAWATEVGQPGLFSIERVFARLVSAAGKEGTP